MPNPQLEMRPNAVVQGKIDRTRSFYDRLIEYPLISTANFTDEGSAFIFTSESGVTQQVVDLSGGVANEKFAGIGYSDYRRITKFVDVVQVTIPSVSPYTIQLKKTTPVVTSFHVEDSDGNVFTNDQPADPTVTEHYNISSGGLLTFVAADASKVLTVRFEYTPTNVELNSRFPQPAYVQQGQTFLNQVAIAVGYCQIFTTMYDPSKNYTIQCKLYTAANGYLTTTTTPVAVAGRCISLPSVGDPYLGIAYQNGTAYTWA